MKIGIITDIHSNIEALNAVLKKFEEEKVDRIICCGDMIGIGINPDEVVKTLMNKNDILTVVIGNHENYLLKGLPKTVHDDKRSMSKEEINNHNWNHSKLSKKSIDYLKTINTSETLEIEGKKIYIVHYPLNSNGSYKRIIKNPSIQENKELFSYVDADIYLYGHSHTTSINNENNKWYINTGSLGCPSGSNIAKAGILEINKGKVNFKAIEVQYDVEKVIKEIKKIKFPFYEKILKIFYTA